MARFLVTFEGERTVGWDEPRWSPRYDCQHFRANGMVERSRTDRSGFDANDRCGPATSEVHPQQPDDCGTRLPRQSVTVHIRRGVVDVDVIDVHDRNTPKGFSRCALILPPNVPVDWPERITGRVNMRDLFDPRKRRVVVQARRGWGNVTELFGGKGRRAESAAVRWKLTFERVSSAAGGGSPRRAR